MKLQEIINYTKLDNTFSIKYLQNLYSYNTNYLLQTIKTNNILLSIKCFIQLPTTFVINELHTGKNKIIKINNKYQFHGSPGNRIICADKCLPFIDTCVTPIISIPFNFPIYNNDSIEILQSNVYYYEVKLMTEQNIIFTPNSWYQECISVGFGSKDVAFDSHVGWFNNSIGFHSDDGSVRFNNCEESAAYSPLWKLNDIIGAGIIYSAKNTIIPFFTFNGKLIYTHKNPIIIKTPYYPIIGYDHSHSIKVNFSNKKFKFNIKQLINTHSNFIIF